MIFERQFLRLLCSGPGSRLGGRLLHGRSWAIQEGQGAGLRFRISHNAEYLWGTSEPPIQAAIASQLAAGSVFYDVGANLGFFSVIAARTVGPSGSVYAFEPVSCNAALIRENAAANRFSQLHVFETAVGRTSGETNLFLTRWGGGATIATAPLPPDATGVSRVPLETLDDAIRRRGLRPPNLVKIDVEGAESDVLDGMRGTIAAHHPTILLEVDDGQQANFRRKHDELDALLAALGYVVERIDGAYPSFGWHVGHSLATFGPRLGKG